MLGIKSTSDSHDMATAKRPRLEETINDSLSTHGENEITPSLIKYWCNRSSKDYLLGGFLETRNSTDCYGKFLHSFCNLEENGILFEQLKIRDGQFLLSINGRGIFGYASVSHDEVIEMFRNLPVNKENNIIVWDATDTKTPIQEIKFMLLEKEDKSKTELKPTIQEHVFDVTSITQTASKWEMGRTVVIRLKNKDYFLQMGTDGKLQIAPSDDYTVDNKCHFEEKTKLICSDMDPVNLILYKHVKKHVFLGYKENLVGLFDGSEDDDYFHFQYCTKCELHPYCRKGTALWYDSQSSSLKVVLEDEHTLGKKFIIESLNDIQQKEWPSD